MLLLFITGQSDQLSKFKACNRIKCNTSRSLFSDFLPVVTQVVPGHVTAIFVTCDSSEDSSDVLLSNSGALNEGKLQISVKLKEVNR